uniref:PDEase domain-containing protein n=1 Tax=Chromera velia CCMP2878 TaxID=1169474 RepID=A0A0G4GJ06_9ALVE|eukprot:Cvel_4773.t1-p1 / transcript=Cvel_4773.t1 / gene=Cvel_4773 / organism=Chromera_velia_CCMP2878 / gene_product=cGMP-specific 3',5'-cGMP phosphodiesterase 3, putative / transcript_product=cGMP-specific 3',5'-cGMP phosphodiesterase 3, putative / location=Cvel_scaffold213:14155-28271(+) / protein_length=1297 / sequence_SO=supercontig / SO=protein_coding / is_pseudo=false
MEKVDASGGSPDAQKGAPDSPAPKKGKSKSNGKESITDGMQVPSRDRLQIGKAIEQKLLSVKKQLRMVWWILIITLIIIWAAVIAFCLVIFFTARSEKVSQGLKRELQAEERRNEEFKINVWTANIFACSTYSVNIDRADAAIVAVADIQEQAKFGLCDSSSNDVEECIGNFAGRIDSSASSALRGGASAKAGAWTIAEQLVIGKTRAEVCASKSSYRERWEQFYEYEATYRTALEGAKKRVVPAPATQTSWTFLIFEMALGIVFVVAFVAPFLTLPVCMGTGQFVRTSFQAAWDEAGQIDRKVQRRMANIFLGSSSLLMDRLMPRAQILSGRSESPPEHSQMDIREFFESLVKVFGVITKDKNVDLIILYGKDLPTTCWTDQKKLKAVLLQIFESTVSGVGQGATIYIAVYPTYSGPLPYAGAEEKEMKTYEIVTEIQVDGDFYPDHCRKGLFVPAFAEEIDSANKAGEPHFGTIIVDRILKRLGGCVITPDNVEANKWVQKGRKNLPHLGFAAQAHQAAPHPPTPHQSPKPGADAPEHSGSVRPFSPVGQRTTPLRDIGDPSMVEIVRFNFATFGRTSLADICPQLNLSSHHKYEVLLYKTGPLTASVCLSLSAIAGFPVRIAREGDDIPSLVRPARGKVPTVCLIVGRYVTESDALRELATKVWETNSQITILSVTPSQDLQSVGDFQAVHEPLTTQTLARAITNGVRKIFKVMMNLRDGNKLTRHNAPKSVRHLHTSLRNDICKDLPFPGEKMAKTRRAIGLGDEKRTHPIKDATDPQASQLFLGIRFVPLHLRTAASLVVTVINEEGFDSGHVHLCHSCGDAAINYMWRCEEAKSHFDQDFADPGHNAFSKKHAEKKSPTPPPDGGAGTEDGERPTYFSSLEFARNRRRTSMAESSDEEEEEGHMPSASKKFELQDVPLPGAPDEPSQDKDQLESPATIGHMAIQVSALERLLERKKGNARRTSHRGSRVRMPVSFSDDENGGGEQQQPMHVDRQGSILSSAKRHRSSSAEATSEVQFAIDMSADPSDLSKASPHIVKKIIENIAHLNTPTCLKFRSVKDDDWDFNRVYKESADLDDVLDWGFDVFKLAPHQQAATGVNLIRKSLEEAQLPFDSISLLRFVLTIQGSYNQVPYHNFCHAITVVQASLLFAEDKGSNSIVTPANKVSLAVAALCHDADHPGVNSKFLVNVTRWASYVVAEFHIQNVIERGYGCPVSMPTVKGTDPYSVASSQVQFIELICEPLFGAMAEIFPNEVSGRFRQMLDNKAYWEKLAEKHKGDAIRLNEAPPDLDSF